MRVCACALFYKIAVGPIIVFSAVYVYKRVYIIIYYGLF